MTCGFSEGACGATGAVLLALLLGTFSPACGQSTPSARPHPAPDLSTHPPGAISALPLASHSPRAVPAPEILSHPPRAVPALQHYLSHPPRAVPALPGASQAPQAVLTLAQGPAAPGAPPGKTHVMEVMGLAADQNSGQPVLILRAKDDKRELMMFIGPLEAQAIAIPLQGLKPPRPLTHDLMGNILRQLNATLQRVVIADLRDGIYFAKLHLRAQGRDLEVDSRPSDAIALALRENVPILAEERVLQRAPRLPISGPKQDL